MCNLYSDEQYYIEINNGIKIPAVGFGTANTREDICETAVSTAIKTGYRLIDTASQYRNERPVGAAIKGLGISRDKVFISSKLWNDVFDYDSTIFAFEESLRWINTDYLDILLIHWPNPVAFRSTGFEKRNATVWKAMEKLCLCGKVRTIGVSNFKINHLMALEKTANIKPMINQICVHPGNYPSEVIEYCKNNSIIVQAYCPLGAGKVLNNESISKIAEKYNKTVAQVCLRWHYQNGIIPLPKSVTPSRMQSNLEIMNFELSDNDMKILNELKLDIKILPDSDEANF